MCLLVSVKRLALDAGQKSLALYGSRAVSLLMGHEAPRISDVDIAILGGEDDALEAKGRLAGAGYRVTPWLRRFQMNRRNTAWIFEATRAGWKFDITAVQSFDLLGQFSIEKILIEMPSEKVIDDGASRAMRRRLLRLSTPLEEAIPHLLLARLIVLSACYELPLGMASRNGRTVRIIVERCRDAQALVSEEAARASAFSALFRSILRARNKRRFLTTISRAGITPILGQTVAKLLAAKALQDDPRLERLSRREELAGLLLRHCQSVELPKLANEIGILRSREWNEKDLRIVRRIEQRVSRG
jgi:hypothetical protein